MINTYLSTLNRTGTMEIQNNIAELLSMHDCVIIPGFGGFIGNYSPARIDPVSHTFYPPRKQLLFNINLKQNDGLLANAVAESLGVPYSEACRIIEEFADECRVNLKKGRDVVLPMVGQLQPGTEGIIHFEQDQVTNLYPDAFGLAPFVSPPVLRHQHSLATGWNLSTPEPGRAGRRFVAPRVLKWAAMLALPFGIAAVIGVTQYDRLSANLASNADIIGSVFSRFSAASLIEKKEAPTRVVKASRPLPTLVKPAEKEPLAENIANIRTDDRYAIIVGAFRIRENAEKFVDQLQQQGVSAAIFDQSRTGLYRVTIGTSATRDQARQLLASTKSTDFSGAWILAK